MPIELPPGTAAYRDDRNPPPKNRQLLILLGLIAVGIAIFFWLLGALINVSVWLIPASVEQQLGKLIVPIYEKQAREKQVNPSPTQDTLNQLLDRLEGKLPSQQRQGRNYQVLYIADKTVNAAAIPGDRILVYGGLLQQMESENELAMVLGHELGHFVNRDHLRGLGRGLVMQLLLAGVVGNADSLQSIAVSGIASLSQARFSQSQEKEADEVGLTLLHAVYGQAAGATDFFVRMGKKEGSRLAIMDTHPPSKERVERLEQLIRERNYPVKGKLPLPETLTEPIPLPQG